MAGDWDVTAFAFLAVGDEVALRVFFAEDWRPHFMFNVWQRLRKSRETGARSALDPLNVINTTSADNNSAGIPIEPRIFITTQRISNHLVAESVNSRRAAFASS